MRDMTATNLRSAFGGESQDINVAQISICEVCGYTADGTLPDKCPLCGATKDKFKIFD